MGGLGLTGIRSSFDVFTSRVTNAAGHPITFCVAVLIIVIWISGGPFFGFSDSYQMIVNTGTTIVTFLMVFCLQASQNRDGLALQTKLDELIRVTDARNELIGVERRTAEEITDLRPRG